MRVVHGKEPSHFLAMFNGRLVIFAGGKAGWGSHQQDEGPGDTYLLQVRGTAAFNTKAEQVNTQFVIQESNTNNYYIHNSPTSSLNLSASYCSYFWHF